MGFLRCVCEVYVGSNQLANKGCWWNVPRLLFKSLSQHWSLQLEQFLKSSNDSLIHWFIENMIQWHQIQQKLDKYYAGISWRPTAFYITDLKACAVRKTKLSDWFKRNGGILRVVMQKHRKFLTPVFRCFFFKSWNSGVNSSVNKIFCLFNYTF
jgi:hypothetical protein